MKVKELIELLKKENPEQKVVVNGYEGGYDELDSLQYVCISLNPDKLKEPDKLWYYGDYEECIYVEGEEMAILFPRKCKYYAS
jgi:hypothetical protein